MTFACHPDYTHPFSGFTWHASPMGSGELICFAAEAQIRFCMEGFYSWASLDKDMKGRGYLSWPLICKGVLQLLWLKYMLVADIPGVCANPDLSCHLFPTAHCYIKCTLCPGLNCIPVLALWKASHLPFGSSVFRHCFALMVFFDSSLMQVTEHRCPCLWQNDMVWKRWHSKLEGSIGKWCKSKFINLKPSL